MGFFRDEHTGPCAFLHGIVPYCGHLLEVPSLRKLSLVCTIGSLCNLAFTVIYLIFDWDLSFAITIGSSQAIPLLGVIMNVYGLTSTEIHFPIIELKKDLWSFDEIEIDAFNQISERYRTFRRTRFILTICTITITATCLPLDGDYRELCTWSYIIEERVNHTLFNVMLHIVTWSAGIYGTTLFSTIVFAKLALLMDICNHILAVREKMNSIQKTHGEDMSWFYNVAYQKFVEDSLKQCIFQHILILKYAKIVKKSLEKCILVVTIAVIGSFALLYLETKRNMHVESLVKSVLLQGIGASFIYLVCKSGQFLMDECEKLREDLCECPWFLWNKSNKSSYLNFLTLAEKPIVFRSLELSLSYNLLIVYARRTMSVLTAMEQLSTLK